MVMEVDGNVHFLNKYMDEQSKVEDEVTDVHQEEVELSGEDLHDMLGGYSLVDGLTHLKEYEKEYPHNDFDAGVKVAEKYLKKRETLGIVQYVQVLANGYFNNLKYWVDTKWLALHGTEEEIVDKLVEFVADVVYEEDNMSVEDFVEVELLGNELSYIYKGLSDEQVKQINHVIFVERAKVAVEGLASAGITKEFVESNSPIEVAKRLLSNTKEVGRSKKRLQVKDKVAHQGFITLELVDSSVEEVEDTDVASRLYANVYKLLVKPTRSKVFGEVATRAYNELKKRLESGDEVRFSQYTYPDAGLVVYASDNVFIVIGSHLAIYQRVNPTKRSLVVRKSVHDVRVKDIKAVIAKL